MAISTTPLNSGVTNPINFGNRRMGFLSVTLAATYATGGFSVSDLGLEAAIGMKVIDQMGLMGGKCFDDVTGVASVVLPRWNYSTQKLELYEQKANNPEIANGEVLVDMTMDLFVIGN